MIKAVVFDMFETLVTLFEGRTYFGEDLAADVGADLFTFRKEWHAIEKERSIGKYTIEEGLELVLKKLGLYTAEKVKLGAAKRREALGDSFSAIPDDTFLLLQGLKERGLKIGLITNTFSDERDIIRESRLFPYFDIALISYEQGICKPDPALFRKMTADPGSFTPPETRACIRCSAHGFMKERLNRIFPVQYWKSLNTRSIRQIF